MQFASDAGKGGNLQGLNSIQSDIVNLTLYSIPNHALRVKIEIEKN